MPPPFSVGHGPFKCSLSPFECSLRGASHWLFKNWLFLFLPFSGLICGLLLPLFVPWKSHRDGNPGTPTPPIHADLCFTGVGRETVLPYSQTQHTHTHKRTKIHTSKLECLILLYALQCCSSGLPCRALRVQSNPSVFRSDATVARSVRTLAHTPDGPWRTGCCRCFFFLVLF